MINHELLTHTAVFIFSACIGSFLNVCIYRIPEGKSIAWPSSFCPYCKKSIPYFCNIPIISYLFLAGRCKFCHESISIRYPMIEMMTGILGVMLSLKFGLTMTFGYWFIFSSTLIIISFIDFDHKIIPDVISLPGIVIFASSFYFVPEMTLMNTITGILIGGGGLYTVAWLYLLLRKSEGMGGGDIKLLAMIGGAVGIEGVVFVIFTGSLLGTLAGVMVMIWNKILNIRLEIPFGPYLSMGTILYIFFGKEIISWYFQRLISYN